MFICAYLPDLVYLDFRRIDDHMASVSLGVSQLEPMPRGHSGDGEHLGEPSRSGEEDQPTGLRADPARPGPQSRAQRLGERGHLPSVGPTVCQNLLEDPQRWGGVRELPVIRPCLSLVP